MLAPMFGAQTRAERHSQDAWAPRRLALLECMYQESTSFDQFGSPSPVGRFQHRRDPHVPPTPKRRAAKHITDIAKASVFVAAEAPGKRLETEL